MAELFLRVSSGKKNGCEFFRLFQYSLEFLRDPFVSGLLRFQSDFIEQPAYLLISER